MVGSENFRRRYRMHGRLGAHKEMERGDNIISMDGYRSAFLLFYTGCKMEWVAER